ncbi:nuclear transport factor 2 family protein [Nocardia aurantiaca]|uniref:nuclear transport factor 2 family protein n=1 Tax=Nocardia aurantiaca TaxID=2675850 RepID=UPI0018A9BDB3|nr:nuclear transport factor 2 family protein [Nocardia aurantiaca]
MSTSIETPRDLVERLFLGLPSRDADRFAALLAPDVLFEIPFPIPGEPTRIEGRERVREYLASRWSAMPDIEIHGIRPDIHATTDPELFVVENDIDITRPGGGRGWFRSSVNVIRVRNGLVTLFRDYMDTGRILAVRQARQG